MEVKNGWYPCDDDTVPCALGKKFKWKEVEENKISYWVDDVLWFVNISDVFIESEIGTEKLIEKSFVVIKVHLFIHLIVEFHSVEGSDTELSFLVFPLYITVSTVGIISDGSNDW